jgi:hypothetical protein
MRSFALPPRKPSTEFEVAVEVEIPFCVPEKTIHGV